MAESVRILAMCSAAAIVAVGVVLHVTRSSPEIEAARPVVVEAVAREMSPSNADELTLPRERVEVTPRIPVEVAASIPAATPVRARVVLSGQLRNSRGIAPRIDLRVRAVWPGDDEVEARPIHNDVRAAQAMRASLASALEFSATMPNAPLDAFDFSADDSDTAATLPLTATTEGFVERDITSFFANSRAIPSALWIEVDHKNFARHRYLVPTTSNGRQIDARALARDGEIELPFDIWLEPRCVMHVQAWSRDGGGRAIRIEAWILTNGRPSAMHAGIDVKSPDDVYELALVPDRRYAIVAFGDGLAPVTSVAYTSGALELWLAPFVLDGGATVAGHVDLGAHLFGGDTWLYLEPSDPHDPHDRFGNSDLIWTGSSFQHEARSAHAATDGAFAFDGLVPGRYRLRVGLERDWWTEMDPVFEVMAPSSNLELRPPLAHVTLQLEQEQLPWARRDLRIRGVGRANNRVSQTLTTDGQGRTAVWLLPGEPYVVEVPVGGKNDWKYGKVAPWNHSDFVELISMSSTH